MRPGLIPERLAPGDWDWWLPWVSASVCGDAGGAFASFFQDLDFRSAEIVSAILQGRARVHRIKNILQSLSLIIGMAAIAAACAWTIWGNDGIFWAFFGVVLLLLLSPSIPPGVILSMYRAQEIPREELPRVYALLEGLAERAGLPSAPRLFYVPSAALNAFAVGSPRSAAIAVTDGLLRSLSERELLGVLAHEVSHIRNNDLWVMGLADVMGRVTSMFSYIGVLLLIVNLPLLLIGISPVSWILVLLLVFAPTLMSLLQLALSRSREFDADLGAAELTGDPAGLASALHKLERYQGRFWEELVFPGRRIPEPSLLRTHPPSEERIRRLLDLHPARAPVDRGLHEQAPVSLPARLHRIEGRPGWRWPGLWY